MKTGLITLLFLVLFQLVNAQSWVSTNPVWHYDYWVPWWEGFVKIEQVDDTIIESHLCQKLQVTDHQFVLDENMEWYHNSINWQARYTYESNDTVYYWNADHFDVLYDFTANANGHWLVDHGTQMFGCNDSSFVKVDNVGTVNLSGENALWMELSDSVGGSVGIKGEVNSRFGAMQDYLFPTMRACDGTIIDDYIFSFKCFRDDSLYYNPSGEDCEYMLTHLGMEDQLEAKFSMYPNPASEWLFVETDWNEGSYEIITASGQKITSGKLDQGMVFMDIKHIPNGVYLMEITTNSGVKSMQRFIVRH